MDLMETKILAALANTDNNDERIDYYIKNGSWILDYQMIYIDEEKGNDKAKQLEYVTKLGFECNSLYYSGKLFCVDRRFLTNSLNKTNTNYNYKLIVTFDTQIISQLPIFLEKPNHSDEILQKVIDLCKSGECSFDCIPYIIENILLIDDLSETYPYLYKTLLAFETLFPWQNGFTSTDIEKRVKELLQFYKSKDFTKVKQRLFIKFHIEYLFLLSIVYINLKHKRCTARTKFDKFLEFCDKVIGKFEPTANNLAFLYFENQNLKFFKKIKDTNKDILADIKNMAWDIFHVRQLVDYATFTFEDSDTIYIPVFISKDKGLNEIRHAFQIKCMIVHSKNKLNRIPSYKMSVLEYDDENYKKYYNEEAFRIRNQRSCNILKLVSKLEKLVCDEIYK